MDQPLDTPRGHRTVVVLGGGSSGAGTSAQHLDEQRLIRGSAFILADKKARKVEPSGLSAHMLAGFAKARHEEEARIAADKAYQARLRPRSHSSAGRDPRRSLSETIEDPMAEKERMQWFEVPKHEGYGRFIERVRRERANVIVKAEMAEKAAKAAAQRAQNADSDSEEEEEEEETPRQSHSSRQRQTEGSSWLGCGLASTRTDDATSERRAAGTLSARSRYVVQATEGATSERRAAGMTSARSRASSIQPTEGATSERRAVGNTSERSRYVVQATEGATGELRAAGMLSSRASANVIQPTEGATNERRAGIPSARASTYVIQASDRARSERPAERPAGMPSAREGAYITPHVGVDANGRHWDDGSLDDVRRRYAWSDYVERVVEKPKPTRRSRLIASMGVWTLSTGVKSRPPSELLEFPSNTKRRPPPQRWCHARNTLGGNSVFVY